MNWQMVGLSAVAGAAGALVALGVAAWAGAWALAESEARMSDESADYMAAEAVRRAARNLGGLPR